VSAAERGARARVVGALLTLASLVLAGLLHHGFGPDLAGQGGKWWEPRGFLHEPLGGFGLSEGGLPSLAVGAVPLLVLAVAVVLTTRSAVARWLAVSSVLAGASFGFYGLGFSAPWEIFQWRWSGTMILFALAVGGALCALWLARSWQRLGWPWRLAVYLPVFVGVVVFERNVTGTDPNLPFALSPWPAVQVFALETACLLAAVIFAGLALGLLAYSRLQGRLGPVAGALVGGLVSLAVPALVLLLAASRSLLPFQASRGLLQLVTLLTAVLGVAASLPRFGQPARLAEHGRLFGTAALLLGLPLLTGQLLARSDYVTTRDGRAQRVIDALEAHYAEQELYPETLAELVDSGRLESIPQPRIGFPLFSHQEFVYQSFGTSYLLEFAAPRWVQCAYNPPYADLIEEEEEGGEDGDGSDLGGSWSCPSNPPELW
jgi:hypothetical protein